MSDEQGTAQETITTSEPLAPKWGDPISEERQAELQGILDAWNTSDSDDSDRFGPFDGVNLSGADACWLAEQSRRSPHGGVRNLHLEGAHLGSAHLEGARLQGAHLEGANLYRAHLERANLSYAQLEGAHLEGAHLERAVLSGAQLEGAELRGAHLVRGLMFLAEEHQQEWAGTLRDGRAGSNSKGTASARPSGRSSLRLLERISCVHLGSSGHHNGRQ